MENKIIYENMEASRRTLAGLASRWTESTPRLATEVPGLTLVRYEAPTEPISGVSEPTVCLVAQGAKRVMLGDEEYVYDANHYLLTSVGLPIVSNVLTASREVPLLGIVMKLDMRMVAQLMVDTALPVPRSGQAGRGVAVSEVTLPLLDAILRLMGLLDTPEDIPILAPLLQKEIIYRLLTGEQGTRLRQIAMAGSHSHQIAQAIDWMKTNYTKPLRVEDLASQAGMSTSTFHHHFRTMTAMSPLQFQKWMRLHEARRLMLTERQDATSAAFQVGYESPSQFSREYRRQFGAPPLTDIKRLQEVAS